MMYPNVRNAPGGRMNIRILVVSGNRVIPNTLPAPRISRALPKIVKPRVKPKPQPRPSKRLAIGDCAAAQLADICVKGSVVYRLSAFLNLRLICGKHSRHDFFGRSLWARIIIPHACTHGYRCRDKDTHNNDNILSLVFHKIYLPAF